MTTNTAGTTARQDPRQVTNTIKRTFNYNDADVAQFAIGTLPSGNDLPSGACITDVMVEVTIAFNAATTNTLAMGTNTGSWNNIIAVTDVPLNSTGVTKVSRGWGRLFTAGGDTAIYGVYTQSGTAATTGSGIVTISFEGGFST